MIPKLHTVYDEPFADASQIPTILVSQLAKEKFTVALTGDGGDEIFAGYNRHIVGTKIWKWIRRVPTSHRKAMLAWLPQFLSLAVAPIDFVHRIPKLEQKITKGLSAFGALDAADFYNSLRMHWADQGIVLGNDDRPRLSNWLDDQDILASMLHADVTDYLPENCLTKVDRASMSVGLEARCPLLDVHLAEFMFSVPSALKLKGNKSKWILKQIVHKYIPHHLMNRPKRGFEVPIDQWLRGAAKDWASELLNAERVKRQGYLDADLLQASWQNHLNGRPGETQKLWSALMFQSWFEGQR